jgi:peptidoglycan/LPS O-acetylase OafA/YrhL
MKAADTNFFENNFNLIRLFAAAQVAHYHLISIYQLEVFHAHQQLVKFLGFFPGVPIFFFISGFLISKSWENSYSWKDYAIKRAGRIEPALIASVILAIVLTWSAGYFSQLNSPSASDLLTLFLAKISILQFYNPEYLRSYGDGVMNGSLWTITVEIQFYILIPVVYLLLLKRYSASKLIILIIAFTAINLVFDYLRPLHSHELIYKLSNVSFLPWFFMFLTGVLFQKHFDFFYGLLRGKFLIILVMYITLCYLLKPLNIDYGNSLNPVIFIALCCLTFSAAYSAKTLAHLSLIHI